MPRSMTGYGSAETDGPRGRFRADLRGTNGRFLEVRLRLPAPLIPYEAEFRRRAGETFQRGRLDLAVTWEPRQDERPPVTLNAGLAGALLDAAARLKSELGVPGDVSLAQLLGLPGVVEVARQETADSAMRDLAMAAVDGAIREADGMRRAEGRETGRDITARLDRLAALRTRIAARADTVPSAVKQRLEERLARLGLEASVDPARLAQEVAYLADKSDIAEELARFESHLGRCRELLAKDDAPCGKTLEFLTQELHREANTIGSKCSDSEIAGWVLDMKTEIERVREQVLNLE